MTGKALVLLPTISGHYGKDSFSKGLASIGFGIVHSLPRPAKDDVLVIWNRTQRDFHATQAFDRVGARIVVVENGYFGKHWLGSQWYAVALGRHNGAGLWPSGGPERWAALGVPLAPWRPAAGGVLVLAQRGIGEPGVKSPTDWHVRTSRAVKGARVRAHPGTNKNVSSKPLADDLQGVSSVITWGSSAALVAMTLGVHVFYEMPSWIGASASRHVKHFGSGPASNDASRLAMFERLSWAMWRREEVASGEAIRKLLE